MAELVRTLREDQRILCPRAMSLPGGADVAHAVAVRFSNAVYEALKPYRDEDTNELPEGNAAANAAAEAMYNNAVTDRMWLMRDVTSFAYGGLTTVETYWWECRLCGFVLPCTAVSHP